MSNARKAAVAALMAQSANGYSNLVLKNYIDRYALNGEDAAFCSRIFYGTVEKKLTLDEVLKQYLSKPLSKLDVSVYCILTSACYQLLYMDTPQHAAVNEAVKLTRAFGKTSAGGMVNAVLHKVCANGLTLPPFDTQENEYSVQYSVAPDIVKLLLQFYPDHALSILEQSCIQPVLSVRVNTLKTTPEQLAACWQAQNINFRKGIVPNSFYVDAQGDPVKLPGFSEGLFQVQGQASQFAAECAGARADEKVLDLCAAPGGKSVLMAQEMKNTGALYSCELHANRLSLIQKALERAGITNAKVLQNDASVYNSALCDADCVLCDVPCSGLGVMAKKPDIRYKTAEQFGSLGGIQLGILETASRYVKANGTLVYSTCTLNPAENEEIIKKFLSNHSDYAAEVLECPFPSYSQNDFGLTIFPYQGLTDGFFVCKLKRKTV